MTSLGRDVALTPFASRPRAIVGGALFLGMIAISGCYASHTPGDARDGGVIGSRDGSVRRDAGVRRDGGVGRDAGFVSCGRGDCRSNESCCILSDDTVSCVPIGTPCPLTCVDEGECRDRLICRREACSAIGTCTPSAIRCEDECPGVCACGDRTYCNGCEAERAGVAMWTDGPCSSDPELGLCERVCARAKPVCGLTIESCASTCEDDLSDCSASDKNEVERCANLNDCDVVIACLQLIPCIESL